MATLSGIPHNNNLSHLILKDVEVGKLQLGEGAFGRVFEVEYAGTICAAKEIHSIFFRIAERDELESIKRKFLEECRIWSTLRHPHIVQFIGVWYRDGEEDSALDLGIPIIVMEKMQCSLRSLVESRDQQEIHIQVKLSILHGVSKGLWYLHIQNPPIVHRDLTPNNILLGEHCEAKITDLGLAKVMKQTDSGQNMTKVPGTPHFMPPESLDDKPKYGPPLDVFSFGGVVLYTITQQWPEPKSREKHNPDTGRRELVSEVERRRQYLDRMTGVLSALQPLVVSCLDDSPNSRPSIVEVSKTIKGMIGDHNKEELGSVPQVLATHLSTVSPLATQLQPFVPQKSITISSPTKMKKIEWTIAEPAPVSCAAHTAVFLNGLVYVGGGFDGRDFYSHYRIDLFNPASNFWSPSPIQTQYCLFAMTVLQNQLVVAGGAIGVKSGWFSTNHFVVNEVLLLDTVENRLKHYSQMITPRSAATAVGHDTILVIVGGWDNNKMPLSTTELLDTITNQWYGCNDLPQPHSWLKPVIVAKLLYLIGGVNQDGPSPTVFSTPIDTLTSDHNVDWKFLQGTPWCRSSPIVVNDSDILVIGGHQSTIVFNAVRTSNIYVLNQVTGTWEIMPPQIPEARSSSAVVSIGDNTILLIGGIKSILSFFQLDCADNTVVVGSFK